MRRDRIGTGPRPSDPQSCTLRGQKSARRGRSAMSDESSAAIRDTRKDWVVEHRDMYLNSGGALGHIMDVTAVGGRSFATHCLVKYIGRKSGNVFITPLCYADIGGEVVI